MYQSFNNKYSFTLIELMVVIAIIGILASLLFPTLGRARKTARDMACVNHLQQIGVAASQYTHDNDRIQLIRNAKGQTYAGWQTLLKDYMGISSSDYQDYQGQGVYKCPANILTYSNKWENGGLAYSPQFGGSVTPTQYFEVKTAAILDPSNRVMAGDGYGGNDGRPWIDNQLFFPSNRGYENYPQFMGTLHKNGINALWADGHVQRKTKAALSAGKDGNTYYYYQVNDGAKRYE